MITFATYKRVLTMPNRRKIGANAFLRKAEEAYKHKGFREIWLTDSGSEGLGFESQRDHIQIKGLQRKLVFRCSPFDLDVRAARGRAWERRSQFQRDHFRRMAGASLQGSTQSIPSGCQSCPWQGLGKTKSIPSGSQILKTETT